LSVGDALGVDTKNLDFRVFESAAKDFGGSRRLLGMRGDPVSVPDIEGTVAAGVGFERFLAVPTWRRWCAHGLAWLPRPTL
jgi:hypothetical protein